MTTITSPYIRRYGDLPAYHYISAHDQLPTYGDLAGKTLAEIVCPLKIFNPGGAGTWWLAAFDPEDGVAWGVAEITYREAGSFSMEDLRTARGAFGLPYERDLHYHPQTVQDLLDEASRR